MSERDLARTQLSKENLTFVERKALTMKYRKLRNKATEQIRKAKKQANGDRIAKAKSEGEVWKVISDITNPKAKEQIIAFALGLI